MAQIIWNKRATKQFEELLSYLEQEFGDRTAELFASRTIRMVELVLKHPQIGSLENKEKNIRALLLHKHTTVFYKEKAGSIYILSLFDNRQHPNKKPNH